jgi:sec-independent protein translocase protein TatA
MELFTPGHLLVLAIVVAVLFFGWKQLPDMARSLGRSLRIFKTEIKGMTEDDKAREAARESATTTPAVDAAPPAAVPTPVTPAAPVLPATPVTPPADTTAPANSNGTSSIDRS